MQKEKRANNGFIPQFKSVFYHPRYWGIWFVLGIMILLTYIPARVRDPLLGGLGCLVGKYVGGARRRARINLLYCLPELNEEARETIIDQMFATAVQTTILMVEQSVRKPGYLMKRVRFHGEEHFTKARTEGRNVIFLVPHGWGIDIPGMLLAARGQPIAAMFHNQRNELVDYLWNAARLRFGGRIHARQDGIKPFISSVRQGYCGYYLPDQDHGIEHSEFVDFFATYKATLPAIGRLMKVCNAAIIPLFPVYRGDEGMLDIYIRPPMDDIADADNKYIARRMNEEVETLVRPNPEQYAWILKLLKTRKEGDIDPYERQDLWPKSGKR